MYELYCKPTPSGDVGDCPFTHSIAMALFVKRVNFQYVPTAKEHKEKWLMERHDGQLPCLRCIPDDCTVVESRAILEYIDASIGTDESKGILDSASSATLLDDLKLFPAFAKFCKNTDANADAALLAALQERLSRLETILSSRSETGGTGYVLGTTQPTMADCCLAPIVCHMSATLGTLKGISFGATGLLADLPAVQRYVDLVMHCESFVQSYRYSAEDCLHGWRTARGEM